jgi:hypothetical protein
MSLPVVLRASAQGEFDEARACNRVREDAEEWQAAG